MGTIEITYSFANPICGFELELGVIELTSTENMCIAVRRHCALCAQEKYETRGFALFGENKFLQLTAF